MTLVLAVNGPETNWMLVDTRLSFNNRPPKEDGKKLMILETSDAVAILGYAGLGQTARGTQPSDWMNAVLRGRNFPLEQMLGTLSDALKREFPLHLNGLIPSHTIVVTAFCNNEVRVYTIDFILTESGKYTFAFQRHVRPPKQRAPRFAAAGSGAHYFLGNKKPLRSLLRAVRAHDRGMLSALSVADEFAQLNLEVHRNYNTVGPRCVVAWRHRLGGLHKGGGAHQFYNGIGKESDSFSIPIIAGGADIQAVLGVLAPQFFRTLDAVSKGESTPEFKGEKLRDALSRLPNTPSERLD